MAAPNYNIDMRTLTEAENTTDWIQINFAGGGGGGLSASPDYALQGTNCVDRQISGDERGMVHDPSGVPAPTTGSGDHWFVWLFVATPGLTATRENRGVCVLLTQAPTPSTCVQYHVDGNDTYGASGRVGKCYPIYRSSASLVEQAGPIVTTTNASPSTVNAWGGSVNITGTTRGANFGVDAVRVGTGLYITGGDSTNAANFSASSAINDNISNRWGVITRIGGIYELQGTYGIGITTASVEDEAYFEDDGGFIQIVDTIHSLRDFTKIRIAGASTYCDIQNYTFLGLGTWNPGQIIVENASTTASFGGCTFDAIGNTFFNANVTASNCIWRNCNTIYTSGSLLSSCNISHENGFGTASVATDNLQQIQNCIFATGSGVVDGGHAIELVSGSGNVTASFIGNQFTNYGANDTSASAIFNNTGGNIVINITGNGDTPTIRNGAGSTTQINNPTTLTIINVISGSEVRVCLDDGPPRTALAGEESVLSQLIYTYNYGGSDDDAFVVIGNLGYEWLEIPIVLGNSDQTVTAQQQIDRNYNNP